TCIEYQSNNFILINRTQVSNEKILLKDLFKVKESIHTRVIEDLEKISFHNLPLIISLFKIYNINILKFEGKTKIISAIKLRHDIVHRSGVNIDNNSLIIINKEEVNKTIELFNNFVDYINTEINNLLTQSSDFPFDDFPF
ncbi:MAG: hypothetical protein LAT51_09080, partial [Flavobacteriaceae bacterium]|nr:hypothetical protein [Flavobacteriaceae bacterium]